MLAWLFWMAGFVTFSFFDRCNQLQPWLFSADRHVCVRSGLVGDNVALLFWWLYLWRVQTSLWGWSGHPPVSGRYARGGKPAKKSAKVGRCLGKAPRLDRCGSNSARLLGSRRRSANLCVYYLRANSVTHFKRRQLLGMSCLLLLAIFRLFNYPFLINVRTLFFNNLT